MSDVMRRSNQKFKDKKPTKGNSGTSQAASQPCVGSFFEDLTMARYVKLCRSQETDILLAKQPKAFLLLSVVAMRAKRTSDNNAFNLTIGQSLIGDHDNYGLTRQEYRTAVSFLEDNNFISTSTSGLGTVATLLNNVVFDINPEGEQLPPNHKATTNKNNNKNKKEKKKEASKKIEFPPELDTHEFLVAWTEWIQFRLDIKKKMTSLTMGKQLKMLAKYPVARAIATIDRSIQNGWQGLFPEQETKDVKIPITKADNDLIQWGKNRGWVEQSDLAQLQAHPTFMSNLANPKFREWATEVNVIVKEI